MRTCPFCAEEIKAAAIVCKHCRRDIPLDNVGAFVANATAPKPQRANNRGFLKFVFWGFCAFIVVISVINNSSPPGQVAKSERKPTQSISAATNRQPANDMFLNSTPLSQRTVLDAVRSAREAYEAAPHEMATSWIRVVRARGLPARLMRRSRSMPPLW
jgi:hypothetical protein